MQCFVDAGEMLVIDPDGCIECAMCVPECPVGAISHIGELAHNDLPFATYNAQQSQRLGARPVRVREASHPEHAVWAAVAEKRHIVGIAPVGGPAPVNEYPPGGSASYSSEL